MNYEQKQKEKLKQVESQVKTHVYMEKLHMYLYVREYNEKHPNATVHDLVMQLDKELNA